MICERDQAMQSKLEHAHSACCGAFCKPVETSANRLQLDEWLHNMLHTQFFTPCKVHREHKKNEATYFCADCGVSSRPLCGHCISDHAGHRLIQIRRYVYCDVVRASDMSGHLDITGVQTYIINQAKVMFLNVRPQSKLGRPGAPDACQTCARTLREGCSFCSLACKVESLVASGKLRMPASTGTTSDSSDGWPSTNNHSNHGNDGTSGDSSSSDQMRASSWDQRQLQEHAVHAAVGAEAAWVRRHSDSDSDGRCSSGSYCCRRKQNSPRRSPLL